MRNGGLDRRTWWSLALGVFGFAAFTASAAGDWTLVDIGTLGGPGSYGAGVSNSGIVVGCADAAAGGTHAFVYRDGALQDLGIASGAASGNSCALAVNDQGVVAGRSSTGDVVVWNGASVVHLGVQGDVGDINDAGVVVGRYVDGTANRAFIYRDGTLTPLGALGTEANGPYSNSTAAAINVRNQVVGASNGHAFLYEGGVMRDLGTLGGNNSAARGINARGEIVGQSSDGSGAPLSFIYRGAMRALPAAAFSSALDINARGQVVGSAEGTYGYVIDSPEGAATRLDRLPAVVAKGWRHLEPTGINDRGWIVGTAVNAEGDLRAFLLLPPGARDVSAPKPLRVTYCGRAPCR